MRIFNILLIVSLLSLSSCSTCDWKHLVDGKASMSCKRGKRAEKVCKEHKGLKDWHYQYALCNDGYIDRTIR